MVDIAGISGLLGSIKIATDMLNMLRNVDFSLEKAELKLKVADAISALADVKIQAAKIQDIIRQKDERIQELQKALELKAKVVRQGEAYYEMNSKGNATGDPYCPHCWEVSYKLIHINSSGQSGFVNSKNICPLCKNTYEERSTMRIQI